MGSLGAPVRRTAAFVARLATVVESADELGPAAEGRRADLAEEGERMLWMLIASAEAGTACWVPNPLAWVGRTELRMLTAEQAAAQAAVEMREPAPIPRHGYVLLTIGRRTLDGAIESAHELVIASDGAEVVRVAGDPGPGGVPSPIPGRYAWWASALSAAVPDGVTFPIVVYAIDKVMGHRCAWSVSDRGKARRLRDGGPDLAIGG